MCILQRFGLTWVNQPHITSSLNVNIIFEIEQHFTNLLTYILQVSGLLVPSF